MPGYVAASGLITGTTAGTVTVGPYTINANTDANFIAGGAMLVSGNNTFAIPSWAAGMLIVPNPANTIALIIKGASGDTGIEISAVNIFLTSFSAVDGPPANFVIHAASNLTTETQIIFF